MKILGIDADSKKIALVCFNNGKLDSYELLISHGETRSEQLYDLIIMFEGQIKAIKPDVVYLEEAIYISNFKTSRSISEVIGNMKFVLTENKIPYEAVAVTSWKKKVIGKGNAKKQDVKDFILKKYPQLEGNEQDIFDAPDI